MMRNVFLPGWGQRAMGRDAQASLYTTSYLASWGTFAAAGYLRNQEITNLNNASDAIEQSRALNAVNQWGNVRNWALGAAAVVWSAALVDALATQPQFLPIMTPGPTPGAWGLQWSVPR